MEADARLEALSQAEIRVIAEMARGTTCKAAAQKLHLSSSTVAFHLANARRKLGAENNVALVAMVILLGIAVPGIWPPVFLADLP